MQAVDAFSQQFLEARDVVAQSVVGVRFAANIERLLGPVGTEIAMRLFAFVLFCIGVQILWLGVDGLLESVRLWVRVETALA